MLIIGAKGFAKEVLEIFQQQENLDGIAFYDDLNLDIGEFLYNRFPILKNEKQIITHFTEYGKQFTLGIGNPVLRHKLYQKFKNLSGAFSSTISPFAQMGTFDVHIGVGSNILGNAIFSNSTIIGQGCIVYYNVTITHDCKVGDFVELSPGATLLGRCTVGDFTRIGANATILPDINIGKNVTIGAGAVVTKNVEDNSLMVGIPARKVKDLVPLANIMDLR